MIDINSFFGEPINFLGICNIYPPKVKDLLNSEFQVMLKILTITPEEIYDSKAKNPIEEPSFCVPMVNNGVPQPLLKKAEKIDIPTPLEFILINAYNNDMMLELTQRAFKFFTHCEILPLFDLKKILIDDKIEISKYTSVKEMQFLDETNFLEFQNAIRQSCGLKIEEPYNPNEDLRLTRMKAKARYRDKIKAQSGQSIKIEQMLAAICCSGIGLTPLNIGEISYASAGELFSMLQRRENYETDIRSLLAGGDPNKIKPKYWIYED